MRYGRHIWFAAGVSGTQINPSSFLGVFVDQSAESIAAVKLVWRVWADEAWAWSGYGAVSPSARCVKGVKPRFGAVPGFWLLVAKVRFLLQTAPFSLSIPSFGTPHVLADVCAASLGGCWVCA